MDMYSYHEGEGVNKEGLTPLLNALSTRLSFKGEGEVQVLRGIASLKTFLY